MKKESTIRTGIISPTQWKLNSTEYSEHQSQQNTKETSRNKLQRTLTATKKECSPHFQITKDTNPNILHKTLSQKRWQLIPTQHGRH